MLLIGKDALIMDSGTELCDYILLHRTLRLYSFIQIRTQYTCVIFWDLKCIYIYIYIDRYGAAGALLANLQNMNIYVYVYVYMYTYMYTHTVTDVDVIQFKVHIYIYIYISIYIHIYMHTCIHTQ